MRAARLGAIALVAVFLIPVGCGSNNAAATPHGHTSPTPAPTPAQSPRTLVFTLACVPGVGAYCQNPVSGTPAHGTVRVDVRNYGYTMTVTVEGLAPSSGHLINFHDGTCVKPDPERYQNVGTFTADAKGTITSVSTWTDTYHIPPGGRVLTVHYDEPDTSAGHIACADLTN